MEESSSYLSCYNQLVHECDSAYHRAAARLGLSDTAFWILYVIRLSGRGLTQKEISELLFLPKQTVHSALKNILEQGILEFRSEAGKREKSLHVTQEGDRFLQTTVDRVLAAEKIVFSRIAGKDMEQFLRTCRTIMNDLSAELEQVQKEELSI